MDGGAWWAAVHGVAKGWTWLSDFTFTFHFPALEKEMAPHSSVLAWRIPGTGKPGGLPSMGSHRVRHDWSDLAAAACHLRNTFWFSWTTSFSQSHCHFIYPDMETMVIGSLPSQTHWGKIPQLAVCFSKDGWVKTSFEIQANLWCIQRWNVVSFQSFGVKSRKSEMEAPLANREKILETAP